MKRRMFFLVSLCLAMPLTASAADVNIFVNKSPLNAGGFIMNDTTYIPLRAVGEALGANVR